MPSRVFTSHAGIEDRLFDGGWAFISSPLALASPFGRRGDALRVGSMLNELLYLYQFSVTMGVSLP
jgi:hypothetical protein